MQLDNKGLKMMYIGKLDNSKKREITTIFGAQRFEGEYTKRK
jgi:hypothetical protein